jgi:hypothetical protein
MRYDHTILFATLTLSACASPTPQIDQRLGQAVREARIQQTLDPQAAARTRPAAGIDGAAAAESVQRYRESFKSPPPTFVIIGAPPSGGGTQ